MTEISQSAILGFAALSFAVIVVPGPSVLFAISRAIVAGRRDALLTVIGNASGVFVQVIFIALGLGVIVTASEAAYTALKLAGAAYLVWLGIHAIRRRGDATKAFAADTPEPTRTPLRDGFVVGITNPKSIVFLAALLPQYVDPAGGLVPAQMMLLGAVLCGIAILSDGLWAVAAARARLWLASDPRRLTWASMAGGLVMVGLGVLLLSS